MAFLEIEGILNGRRLRRCSPTAHWRYGYYLLLTNGYGRIEMDFESISYRLVSFRGTAPSPQDIEAEFAEYAANHLIFVYEHNGRKWAQFDTPNSGAKEWKSASDMKSPMPPEKEYSDWLIEHHGEDWKRFHWFNPSHKTKGLRQSPTWASLILDEDLTKSMPSNDQGSGLGLGLVSGLGKSTKTKSKPSRGLRRVSEKITDPRFSHCVEILHRYWNKFSQRVRFDLWFDGAGGTQLKNSLNRHRSMTVEEFTNCVANRARSPGVRHEEPFYLWGGHILEWAAGPKGANGHVQPDKAERRNNDISETAREVFRADRQPDGNAPKSLPDKTTV